MFLNFVKVISVLSLVLICSCVPNSTKTNDSKNSNSKASVDEMNYPWSSDVERIAIEAIYQSIENLKLPKKERPTNFPSSPGPLNMPFVESVCKEYLVVGYGFAENEPTIYEISFQEKGNIISGPSITVRINIETKTPLMVFMSPDA